MVAATFGAGQVVYSILWTCLFFVEVWLMISVFVDIFRSHDLRGWAKAAWVILVLLIPLVGILAYLIVRGDKMRAHQLRWSGGREDPDAWRADHAGSPPRSVAEELSHLAQLRDRGDLTPEEFQHLKERLIHGASGPS